MKRLLTLYFTLLLGCTCTTHAYAQVFAGLTADFEDNTTQGFGVGAQGAGVTPVVVGIDGGLALQNQSLGGGGALSAQLLQNNTTFTGDYISAGITGISATVAVDPTSEGPLFLRLGFTDSAAGGTGFSSADALVVQNDGEFVDLFFEINDTALVNVPNTGTASFEEVLSNVDRLRILSAESGPAYMVSGKDRLASVLLIDNIVAVGGPPVLLGDVNLDKVVNFLDITPFISLLSMKEFLAEADINQSGEVNFLDISGFISILSNPGS